MMYRIFGESPTIKIVEWLIEHQEFDHSLVEIAEGVKLSAAVAKRNFEPLIKYHVVRVSRTIRKDAMYVLDVENKCTKAIVEFDGKIARCCEETPTIEEYDASPETNEAHERYMAGLEESSGPTEILPPEM